MAFAVSLGQCSAIDSPLHRLDPRVKLVGLIVLVTLSFFITDVVTGAFLAVVLLAVLLSSHLPANILWRTVKPFLAFLTMSFVFNVVFLRGGIELFSLGPLVITTQGIETGLLVTYRAFIALIFGVLLVSTTTPIALADALECLLTPLKWLGVPTQDVAMIIAIALRTIPMLSEEASQVVVAQKSRGAGGFDQGLPDRLKSYASLVVPLLGSSLRHAERLAQAMDARCYTASPERTHLNPLRFAPSDIAVLVLTGILCVGFFTLKLVG